MNTPRTGRAGRRSLSAVAVLALAACDGPGSDIGPRLPPLPDASCKVVVLDDQGRGVVEARVQIGGDVALTGRNGRGDFLADPRGRVIVEVDGGNGSAVAGDRLGSVRFAATVVGPDLPAVLHLPDLPDASARTLDLGVQAVATTIVSPGGGELTTVPGGSVGFGEPAATVTVRTGDLAAAHVPGDLPTPVAGALLTGRVYFVDPPSVSFTPPIDLSVPDDLGLAGGATATLYHLDAATGEWTAVVSGLAAAGGRIDAPGAIASGGAWMFGCEVAAAAVSGRVVEATASALPDALVTVDGRRTTTDRNGRYVVERVPASLADGSPRSALVELFAGGSWLPARRATTVAVTAGATIEAGQLALDTMPAGNVRVQQILRGRAEFLRRARTSSVCDAVSLATISDAAGQVFFEDVPSQWFGFEEGRPLDVNDVVYGQSVGFLDNGRRWLDSLEFFEQRPWFLGTRQARAIVVDAVGCGPVCDAVIVRGSVPGSGFVGRTSESGTFFVDRDFSGRATATLRSAREGRTIVHAISLERPDAEHVELPVQRVLRTPLGAFDRHGVVAGTITGADPGREHRLRATRRLELQEWWEDVFEGTPIRSALPIEVDPAATHGAFAAGVDRVGGHLACAEVTTASGRATLHALGVLADVVPTEGARIDRDIALDRTASTPFVAPSALVGLDASIAAADLQLTLALEQPSGRVVDVVRGIGGNHTVAGNDLTILLPGLTGQLAGHRWLAALRGSGSAAGGTVVQQSLLRLRGGGGEAVLPMLAPPIVTSPAAGASVPPSGFTVQFSLPAGVLYATIELRSESGGDLLLWQAYVPPEPNSFTFPQLPVEAATPLVAGRTYTLTLTAFRASAGPLLGSSRAYADAMTFLHSIGAAERGVDTVASHSITITTS